MFQILKNKNVIFYEVFDLLLFLQNERKEKHYKLICEYFFVFARVKRDEDPGVISTVCNTCLRYISRQQKKPDTLSLTFENPRRR